MDRRTVDVYEHNVEDWIEHRRRPRPPTLDAFVARVPPGVHADVGCGPGWHTADLGAPVVAFDAAVAMVEQVREFAPDSWRVVADLERLPFRRGALTGAWGQKCYMHIADVRLPMALAELHRSMAVGGTLHVQVTSDRQQANADDRFPGRHFTWWPPDRLRDVVEGAGFEIDELVDDGEEWIDIEATRARMLPDTVGPDMRVLLVGLNPSVYSADAGYGFARPGNRFWPAALASGLVTTVHDTFRALHVDGIGMTNLVRRATPNANGLSRAEYVDGGKRLERLVRFQQPRAVCFIGFAGYRNAIDKNATAGWRAESFGGVPAYVMPNTSGLNAHTKPAEFIAHFRAVQRVPA